MTRGDGVSVRSGTACRRVVGTVCAVLCLASALLADVTVRVPLVVTPGHGADDAAILSLAPRDGAPLQVILERSRLTLRPNRNAADERAAAVHLAPGPHELLLKCRGDTVTALLDRTAVARVQGVSLGTRPRATMTGSAAIRADGAVRVQKIAPVTFGDDFAREADAPLQWEVLSGRFALNTSLNPGSSQGAFQLWASAAEDRPATALAEASHWFWDDLRIGVSAMAPELPASWGVLFNWIDTDNHHRVVWQQPLRGPGMMTLLRRQDGVDHVLAEAPLSMQAGQWHRLQVLTRAPRLRVFLAGREVLATNQQTGAGGRIGLTVPLGENLYIDDVAVVSADPAAADPAWNPSQPFGPSEQPWSDFSKKSFYSDEFMVQWAHPRSLWEQDRQRGLYWFRSRFFHDVTLSWTRGRGQDLPWPGTPLTAVLFADRSAALPSGYRLTFSREQIRLSRNDVEVDRAPLEATSIERLTVSVAEGTVSAAVNGSECLRWTDNAPLTKGDVGVDLGRTFGMRLRSPDWRDTARVESSHRLDYNFDHAPAAWAPGSGEWRGTHRWACVPKWSFFGGRGIPGPPECANGNALLWNLRRFQGDFDLELFAAPMEGTPQRVHFAYPITLNVGFMADGKNLDSGYMLVFGAYDVVSTLFRKGEPIAVWDKRVQPGLRRRPMPWYGRMTRVWQHLRIQRRDGRILVDAAGHDDRANYLGLERLFEVEDTLETPGDRFGIWTWGPNGLAVARATVSFEASAGPAEPTPRPPSLAERRGRHGEPPRYIRVRNPGPGGFFAHKLGDGPITVTDGAQLLFDMRSPSAAVLSLFAGIRGQTAEAVISGPRVSRPFTIPLGAAVATPLARWPGWSRIRIDLGGPLREAFPHGELVLERLAIGSPFDGIRQIAGLGLHHQGDSYDVANVRWEQDSAAAAPADSVVIARMHGRRFFDDFEADLGEWTRLGGSDGAALYRDPTRGREGGAALRLLNQVVAGPAGAWMTQTPFSTAAFPQLQFDYRIGPDVELNLIIQTAGQTCEVTFTGTDATWPVIGRVADVHADGEWHTATLDLHDMLARRHRGSEVTVESIALADTWRMSTPQRTAWWLDNVCLVPALPLDRPVTMEIALSDGSIPSAVSYVRSDSPETEVDAAPEQAGAVVTLQPGATGRFVHVRAQRPDGSWTAVCSMPVIPRETVPLSTAADTPATPAGPPAAPAILYLPSDRLSLETFEWDEMPDYPEAAFGDLSSRRGAWILQGRGHAATGNGHAVIQNLNRGSFFSAYLHRGAWDPMRWPMVSFDYRFPQRDCALNLSFLVNDTMTIVEWTGPNVRGSHFYDAVIGRTEKAVQDGQWHHSEVNLAELLVQARFQNPDRRGRIRAAEWATWATNHHGGGYRNPQEAQLHVDNVCIYSNYGANPRFRWNQPAGTPRATHYAVTFDQNPESVPPATDLIVAREIAFQDLSPGTYYLHVRPRNEAGWGPTSRRSILVEKPPEALRKAVGDRAESPFAAAEP